MTGNIWIGLQMSLADIEAEIPDIPDEPPRVPFERDANFGRDGR